MTTTCAAPGCNRAIASGLLMCRDDWAQVPEPLQRDVLRTWKALRNPIDTRPGKAEAYRQARDAAIKAVLPRPFTR